MNQDLKQLISQVVPKVSLVAAPLALAAGLIFSWQTGVSLILGAAVSLGAFSLGAYLTDRAFRKGQPLILVATNILKILLVALLGFAVSRWGMWPLLAFIFGYSLIFLAFISYTKDLK